MNFCSLLYLMTSIYQQIYGAKLDRHLEDILLKLLKYNQSADVQGPVRQFLQDYRTISYDFSESYRHCNEFDSALEAYRHFAKNKCVLIDTLLQNLQYTLSYGPVRAELSAMLRDGFTF